MTDLTTLLARALRKVYGIDDPHSDTPNDEAAAILATPEGQRISAVIEAAVAWRRLKGYDPEDDWENVSDNLCAAIDALLEERKVPPKNGANYTLKEEPCETS